MLNRISSSELDVMMAVVDDGKDGYDGNDLMWRTAK
jgi:hypothetical protein